MTRPATTRPATGRTLRTDRRAVAVVEFALVASLLFVVSFGVIDLGMILWTQGALQAIAADAARCGAIHATGCTSGSAVQTYVRNEATTWVMSALTSDPSHLTINVNGVIVTGTCPAITLGTYETVQITTSYLGSWLPPPFRNYTINVCASYAM